MKTCYEYTWYDEIYFCCGCRELHKDSTAVLEYDEERKEEYIKVENKPHACIPLPYHPHKYEEIKILKKPGYEFLEDCSLKLRRVLFVFNPNDPSLCYEYLWNKSYKRFYCRGCHLLKKEMLAEICNEGTQHEFLRALHNNHICEYVNYKAEKYLQFNAIVTKPDFEIQTTLGSERKRLIIFDKDDKKLCYVYHFDTWAKKFTCSGCKGKGKSVGAKLCQNSEGEEYVTLSKAQHYCSLRTYIPPKKEIIIRSPQFKVVENDDKKKQLFIFISDKNHNQCYKFKPAYKHPNRYNCNGCINFSNNTGKSKSTENIVYCFLKEEGKQQQYILMPAEQKHQCQPQKCERQKKLPTIQSNDYFFFQQIEKLHLAIFHPKNRNLCYKYDPENRQFICKSCTNRRVRVTARIQQNSDGTKCAVLSEKKHVCTAIKVSSIQRQHDVTLLEKMDFNSDQKSKQKRIVDESKLVRLPNYELQRSRTGVKDGTLLVFKDDDRSLCYEYCLYKKENVFICGKCKRKGVCVRAHVHIDETSGENCIALGKNNHICEPSKYQPEKNTNEIQNFMIFNRENEKSKPMKLVIFTSASKELCYEFVCKSQAIGLVCRSCFLLKKSVSAKILKNANGQDVVQLSRGEHICQPKEFFLEEFQPKIISKPHFLLFSNHNGNSRLIIFDEKREGFCFVYLNKSDKAVYFCTVCDAEKHKYVSAKLINGGENVEISPAQHLCESIKFDSEKYDVPIIISQNFVLLHDYFTGESSSKLTIFDSNDFNFGYNFFYDKTRDLFYCRQCRASKPKKNVFAKLLVDENGKHSVELKHQHICEIQNLQEMKRIVQSNNFEVEGNGNKITAKHPIDKKLIYKFEFNQEINAFQCIQCQSKNGKCLTATICKNNSGKDFLLLNDFHRCKRLRK
uniref:Uncharacterized protein n=1 Tax=Panagrolaimus sp. ES5 TaxID=591445 RepID=A0AC34GVI0_9BILA